MRLILTTLGLFALCYPARAAFQPLVVEIGPERPLLIFAVTEVPRGNSVDYAEAVKAAWSELPGDLKPFSVLLVDVPAADAAARQDACHVLLGILQQADIPTAIRIASGDPQHIYPLDLAEELVWAYPCIKGFEVTGLAFEDYYAFGSGDEPGLPPSVRWLIDAIDLAAEYRRFVLLELGELRWPRLMSHGLCEPLYEKLRECRAYTVPTAPYGPAHNHAQLTSLMGFWLEGATEQWGLACNSEWYAQARLIEPGVFGPPQQANPMPAPLYRAMILNGAMTGATAYVFSTESDLWFGSARHYWDEVIYPTLKEIIHGGLIARKSFVEKKVQVAYQLGLCRTPQDFHVNLRDIDGVFDEGLLIRGAYGMERRGQVPELIPNSGRHYWIPIISPYAPPDALDSFAAVVHPGDGSSASAWTELLARYYEPDGGGSAFISGIGRAIFVMQTHENLYEEQTFRIPECPAPVRAIEASRQENGVALTWPLREGDVAYTVYRRMLPDGTFSPIADTVGDRRYLDPGVDPDSAVAYTVTALTSEQELYEGTVNYGDYLAISVVQSRIAEEVVLDPAIAYARSRPVEEPQDTRPKRQAWWPSLEGLGDDAGAVAEVIAARIEAWDQAVAREDLNGVLDLYTADYQDPQGWEIHYVERAYQWFFERYSACTMHRQVRRWDFSNYDSERIVRVLLYCRFTGVAISDPTGRFADLEAYFPRTDDSEIWLTFTDKEGVWRIARTEPALPNFKDLLTFSAGPYDALVPGPDIYPR